MKIFLIIIRKKDFAKCDLLIIMGTSLQVHPFAQLTTLVDDDCPRLLINNERVGCGYIGGKGLALGSVFNYRDVEWLGDLEVGVKEFAKELQWEDELNAILKNNN